MRRIPLLPLALVAGVASALAFQPVGWWPLMILAIAGLCEIIARAGSLKRALAAGWLFGLGQFALGLNWIATAFTFQAAMPAWLGWVAVGLLSVYLAIYPAMASGLAWRFGRHNRLALALALAGGWAVTEWLRATMFTGFSWNPAGVTLVDTPLRGSAQLIGTYGLSTLVFLLASSLWLAAHRRRLPAAGLIAPILVMMLLFAPAIGSDSDRRIRVVQPNIGQQDKWRPGFEQEAYRRLETFTGGSPGPRLIFWPEAAVTDPLEDARRGGDTLAMAERLRATRALGPDDLLLTGGLGVTSSDGLRVDGATNSVYALDPSGRVAGRYDKAHLVPYGEYLPMRPLLSTIGLSRLAPGDMDFAAGPGPRTLQLPGNWGKAGFQLCYEIIFSGEVVDRSNRPDFIFNPSNDAWFGRWGPPQHLAQARLRAAEERLPVIRSTPTGISAVIGSGGELKASIPWHEAGAIDGLLPLPEAPGLFARLGNIIPLGLGFLLIGAAIALSASRRYSAI